MFRCGPYALVIRTCGPDDGYLDLLISNSIHLRVDKAGTLDDN